MTVEKIKKILHYISQLKLTINRLPKNFYSFDDELENYENLQFVHCFNIMGWSKDLTMKSEIDHKKKFDNLITKYPEISDMTLDFLPDGFYIKYYDKCFYVRQPLINFLHRGLKGYSFSKVDYDDLEVSDASVKPCGDDDVIEYIAKKTVGKKEFTYLFPFPAKTVDYINKFGTSNPMERIDNMANYELLASIVNNLTCVAWDKYSESVGGKSYNGDPLPTWEEMTKDSTKEKVVLAWQNTIVEVLSKLGYDEFKDVNFDSRIDKSDEDLKNK